MKQLKFIFLCLVLAFCCSSCAVMAKILFGISVPKEKSEQQLAKGINKYELEEFDHYSVSEEGFKAYIKTEIQTDSDTERGFTICQPLVFKNGKLVYPAQIKGCSSKGVGLIRQLQDSTAYVLRDSILIDSLINTKNILQFDSIQYVQATQGKEFVILLYWAVFAGKLNKNSVKYPAEVLKREIDFNNLNAVAFFVNLDIKKGWSFQFKNNGRKVVSRK